MFTYGSNGASTTVVRPEVHNADLQAFIDANLAAAHPDGEKSLSEFKMTDSVQLDGNNIKPIHELDVVVTALATHTQAGMVSFYDFEASVADIDSTNSSEEFKEIQKTLDAQWDGVLSYLHECQAFGEDVFRMKKAAVHGSSEDLMRCLTKMSVRAAKLRDLTTAQKTKTTSLQFPNMDNLRIPASGQKSLSEIKDALFATGSYLTTFQRFWEYTLKNCQSYLGESANGITSTDAERIADVWTHYHEEIEKALEFVALTNISSCDVLDSLVSSATKGLQLIEPWREARTNHPVLQKHIGDIQRNGVEYCRAIDLSIKTAQDGYDISSDVVSLCSSLSDPSNTTEDIQEYIVDIKMKAKSAHKDSTDSLEAFRSVHRHILEVTRNIPDAVKKAIQSTAKGHDTKGNTYSVQLVGGKDGSLREVDFDTAMAELKHSAADLAILGHAVELFVAWWARAQAHLSYAERNASFLNPQKKVPKLRLRGMDENWRQINGDYLRYKIKIIQLQDITNRSPRVQAF